MNRIKLLAVAAVAFGAGALAAPAIAHKLTYKVEFTAKKGKYMESAVDEDGSTWNERDDFLTLARYKGLKIPRHGPGFTPGDDIVLAAAYWDIFGSWEAFGKLCRNKGDCGGSFDCKGEPVPLEPAPVLYSTGTASRELHLNIEAGRKFAPDDVTGSGFGSPGYCKSAFEGNYAYVFGTARAEGYVPDMLTAQVDIPLRALRKMDKGDVWGRSFDQSHAEALPPSDCSDGTGECTVSVHWRGAVKVTRTG